MVLIPLVSRLLTLLVIFIFFFQAEDGIRDSSVTGVQTCALPISRLLPGLRGMAGARGAARARANPLSPVRALRWRLAAALARVRLLQRARSRAPGIAGHRRAGRGTDRRDVCELPRSSQVVGHIAGGGAPGSLGVRSRDSG